MTASYTSTHTERERDKHKYTPLKCIDYNYDEPESSVKTAHVYQHSVEITFSLK